MISTIQHKVLVEPELHVTKDHNSSNHTDFMQPNGIASLDSGGKVPLSQLPITILDGLQYKGTWDCSSGAYPVLTSTGDYYICNVAGTITGTDYFVGDWLAYNGTTWDRVEGSSNFRSLLRTSTSYVITDTDGYGVIEVDPKGITVPIYLPTALDNKERLLTVKSVDTGTVTITGEGAETIDGYATYSLRVSGDSWIGYSNGVEWKTVGGSSSASGTSFVVTQTTHGMSILSPIYLNAGTWTKAQANISSTLATHVVTQVLDADNFMAAQSGRFLITSHGLTPYSYYYLSSTSTGVLTTSEPTTFSNLLVFVESADYVHILPYRPLDTTLIALRDLNTSTGLIVETSTDVFTKRTLYGTTNKIEVTNGNGVSGHPTLNIGSDVVTLTGSQVLSNKTFSDQITSTQSTGTAPFIITSSTGVTNLNSDLLDGVHISSLTDSKILRYSSTGTKIENSSITESSGALSGITTLNMSGQFTNTLTTGTPPFIVTSSTGITNLNADLLDGTHIASLTNTRLLRYNSTSKQIENATITENSGALGSITTTNMSGQLTSTLASGTPPFVLTSSTGVTNLNADLLDGQHSSYFEPAQTKGTISATSPIIISDATRQAIGGAIAFSHDSGAGNIHLPSGGSSNQILKNSGSSGTGSWGTVTENSGALAAITTIGMSGQLTNTLASGTPPFVITSSTGIVHLNADMVDSCHATCFSLTTHNHTIATENVYVGTGSLYSNTTSIGNSAYGYNSGYCNTSGCYNTMIGDGALYSNQTKCYSTAVGYNSLYSSTCSCNTAVGYQAGMCISTGISNTMVGMNTLGLTTSGCYNIALGTCTLYSNISGCYSTAIGYCSLAKSTCGYNTALGYNTGACITTGCYNNITGYQAGFNITTGCYNVAKGANSLYTSCTGSYNTAIGYGSLCLSTVSNNTATGYNSFTNASTGTDLAGVGSCSGLCNTSGCFNTAIGSCSSVCNATCGCNTAIGYKSLYTSTCGINTAVGTASGACITTGQCNITIGCCAGSALTTCSCSIVIGNIAGTNTSCATYIDNIYGSTCGCTANVYVASDGRLSKGAAGGGSLATIRTITSTGTATITDNVIILNGTSTSYTVTLPAASTATGVILRFIQKGTGIVTIDANASELISGQLTQVLQNQWESMEIVCDGTSWYIL